MSTEQQKLEVTRTERQKQAWDALNDPLIRRVMYGGAKGGGKSYMLCVWAFMQAYNYAYKHKLLPTSNPIHVGWIGRKRATDFTATTLQTWRRAIPEQYYKLKGGTEKDPKHILILDRIAIDYGGLDNQENINKFNSAEYAFFCIDQAEETTRDDISVLQGSLRLTIKGQKLDYKELYTANPGQCWLKNEFISSPMPENVFVPALPGDNPHLPEDYTKTLETAFKHRPELLKAYLFGSWDSLDGATQVIKSSWIENTKKRNIQLKPAKHYLVCDTARFGDDETVIGRFQDLNLVEKLVFGYCKSTEISSRLAAESNKHGQIPIVVEAVGSDLGACVVDELETLGHKAVVYCPQAASHEIDANTGKPKFYNIRAEAWWKAAEMLSSGNVKSENMTFVVACPGLDETIAQQLLFPSYDFRDGKLLIESKADIKKRLGRSPDHADMFVIAYWSFDKLPFTGYLQNEAIESDIKRREYDPLDIRML